MGLHVRAPVDVKFVSSSLTVIDVFKSFALSINRLGVSSSLNFRLMDMSHLRTGFAEKLSDFTGTYSKCNRRKLRHTS